MASRAAKQLNIQDKIEAAERVLKSISDEGVGNSTTETGAFFGFIILPKPNICMRRAW